MVDQPSDSDDAPSPKAGKSAEARRKKQLMGAGVAVGIGSAAIVAALLYANRGRKGDKEGGGA